MRYLWPMLMLVAAPAFADDDEVLVEQLMQRHASVAKTPQPRPPKTDPAQALIGHAVRVRTLDRGLYLGVLATADANAIHLDIAVPGQALGYALPRSAVAQIEAVTAP